MLTNAIGSFFKKKCEAKSFLPCDAEYSWTYMRADLEGLTAIRKLCEAGKMKIPVEKTFPITQVKEAHEAKDKRIVEGKVVLEVD